MNNGDIAIQDHHEKVCGREVKKCAGDQEKQLKALRRITQLVYVQSELEREEGQSNEQISHRQRQYRPIGYSLQSTISGD